MKKIIGLLAVALLLLVGVFALADSDTVEFDDIGVTVTFPDEVASGIGVFYPAPYGAISYNPNVYYLPMYYFAMSEDEFVETTSKDDLSDEEKAAFRARQLQVASLLGTNGTLDDIAALFEVDPSQISSLNLVEVGNSDGYTFYFIPSEEDLTDIQDVYAEQFTKLQAALEEAFKKAVYHEPVDEMMALVGQTVTFETVDTDGNAVSSKDLFAGNKITMINYWGTWCHNCVDEMEELAAIHTRLQEKGCGVIGILQDVDELETAKQIMQEKGTNYPVVLQSADMAVLENVTGFPTSFFVDKDGVVRCPPVVGANVSGYEPTVDQLLAGESVSVITMPEPVANSEGAYRVYVVDSNGKPIEGVVVQFCDDTSCNMGKTDADGLASFNTPEGHSYIVHMLKVPAGYAKDNTEYHTLETYSDIVVVLAAE